MGRPGIRVAVERDRRLSEGGNSVVTDALRYQNGLASGAYPAWNSNRNPQAPTVSWQSSYSKLRRHRLLSRLYSVLTGIQLFQVHLRVFCLLYTYDVVMFCV